MIEQFSKLTGFSVSDILGASRVQPLSDARHVYWWMLRRLGYSYQTIGQINNRTHAAVLSGVTRVENALIVDDEPIKSIVSNITPLIENLKSDKIMNAIKQVIELTAPINENGKKVTLSGASIDCACCGGKGYIYQGGYMTKFKNDLNESDYKFCPVCNGTRRMKAVVSVEWLLDGETIDLPKDEE